MADININEYVRTKRGEICKVLGIRQEQRTGERVYEHLAYYLDNHKGSLTPAFIVKHSPNIIDLIEKGDYVNESKIIDIVQAPIKAVYTENQEQKLALIPIINEQIKSVVTKEQFNQVKYEV
jgi:hypothetical protein